MDEIKMADCIFGVEGDMICCMEKGLEDMMVNPVGYGRTDKAAFEDFLENWAK